MNRYKRDWAKSHRMSLAEYRHLRKMGKKFEKDHKKDMDRMKSKHILYRTMNPGHAAWSVDVNPLPKEWVEENNI